MRFCQEIPKNKGREKQSRAPVKYAMLSKMNYTGQAKTPQYHLPELRGRQRRRKSGKKIGKGKGKVKDTKQKSG
jgi:hypothetical protein